MVKAKREWKEQDINVNKGLSLAGGTVSDFSSLLHLSFKLFFEV